MTWWPTHTAVIIQNVTFRVCSTRTANSWPSTASPSTATLVPGLTIQLQSYINTNSELTHLLLDIDPAPDMSHVRPILPFLLSPSLCVAASTLDADAGPQFASSADSTRDVTAAGVDDDLLPEVHVCKLSPCSAKAKEKAEKQALPAAGFRRRPPVFCR